MMQAIRSMAFCTAASMIAAAAALTTDIARADEKNPTIAVAMKTQVQRRWAFDVAAMEREAKKHGAKLIVQWANDDPALQASQVENLLSQKPDALIIVPVDSQAAGRIVRSAHDQGVPVIGYDVGITTARLDYFLMRNNKRVGELQAEGALKMAPKGTFALVKGDPGNDVAQAIAKEYDARILNNNNVKVVFNQFIRGWDPKAALSNAENVLSAQADKVDGFVTANDGMALGISQALKARGLAGKVYLSGLDADAANLQLIAQGVQTMSVWTDLDDAGSSAVKAAVAFARKQKPSHMTEVDLGAGKVPTHLVKVIPVTKDSLCSFISKDAPKGWVTEADVFGAGKSPCR
ncbi:substrate-binding domain-containing protein [Hydrogenophaga sp.]|uniref:substrate-binding domain-containing protein n=1 Tax=Hydrogenophaga sp. TaxID=1904254 RepID=UPI002630F1BA|nr:substrate-binding domain-containing protein [Hydrogenophaga sp.]